VLFKSSKPVNLVGFAAAHGRTARSVLSEFGSGQARPPSCLGWD